MTDKKAGPGDSWQTPQSVIDYVEKRFGDIAVDLCATAENKKGAYMPSFFSEENSMLTADELEITEAFSEGGVYEDTGKIFWCNPPYSNPLPFVKTCKEIADQGYTVIMLLNLDTSTKWFSVINEHAKTIFPIVGGRISFVDGRTGCKIKGNNKPQLMVKFAPFGLQQWESIDIKELI